MVFTMVLDFSKVFLGVFYGFRSFYGFYCGFRFF